MEVTDIEAIPVEMDKKPLEQRGGNVPYIASRDALREYEETGSVDGKAGITRRTIVRLETDEGIVGWGETPTVLAKRAGSYRSIKTLFEDAVAPAAVGHRVEEIGAFSDNDFLTIYGTDLSPLVAAVEIAMWDARGKQLGVPVHELLGGRRVDAVETACCLAMLPIEEAREKAREFHDMGFDVLKTKGSTEWKHDIERVRAMHDAVDGEMEFRLDANQDWSFEDAVRVGAHLEQEDIFIQYLEQPVRAKAFGTYKRLRERLRQPVGVNEDMYESDNLIHLIKEDAIDTAVLEMSEVGGIHNLRQMAAVGRAGDISMSHHASTGLGVKTAAVLHTVSATPAINLAIDSVYHALTDDVIATPFEYDEGALPVPDDPGLGVAVDESKLDRYRVDT